MSLYIQRTKALGDVVMVAPILDFLVKRGEKVVFITSEPCVELFDGLHSDKLTITTKKPYIKQLIRKTFHKIHRLNYEKFPQLPVQEAYAKILNLKGFEPKRPQLHSVPTALSEKLQKPYVLIHTETNSDLNYRQIYGVDWQEVIGHLIQENLNVYKIENNCLYDKKGEKVGGLSIRDLKAVMAASDLFIGNDSFPSHLAIAFHRPSVVFFGAVSPLLRHPDLKDVVVIQNDCEFSGCYHNPDFYAIKNKPGTTACQIVGQKGTPPCCIHSSEKVISAIDSLLNNAKNW